MGKFGGGCDYQTPWFNHRVVIGVFGDYDPMSLKGSNSPSEIFPATGAPDYGQRKREQVLGSSARARAIS